MPRHPTKLPDEKDGVPTPSENPAPTGAIIEREINIALLNDKLNYAIGLLHEIAKACDIDLSKK